MKLFDYLRNLKENFGGDTDAPLFNPFDLPKIRETHRIKFAEKGEEVKTYTIAEFEEIAGMRYLPTLAFRDERTFDIVKKECTKAFKKKRISPRAQWLGARYHDEVNQGLMNEVSIRWVSDDIGYGLFADKDIQKGELIGEYTGMVRPFSIFYSTINEYCFRYPLYGWRLVIYTIDAKRQGNEISFVNHSDLPNTDAVVTYIDGFMRICLRALKDIPKDAEFTYDYGYKP